MNREMRTLHEEMETLIRLHRHGLFNTPGYIDRKKEIKEFIRENRINLEDLEPLTLILYRRYFE